MVKYWISPKIRNNMSIFAHTTIISHSAGDSGYFNKARKLNKNHTNHKGRKKTVPLCTLQDYLCRKSQGIYKTRQNSKN